MSSKPRIICVRVPQSFYEWLHEEIWDRGYFTVDAFLLSSMDDHIRGRWGDVPEEMLDWIKRELGEIRYRELVGA